MSISGIGGFNPINLISPGITDRITAATKFGSPAGKTPSVEQEFLNEVRKPAGQRMIEAWLKAHNLTKDDLNAMTPEKRNAILKQMAEEIKEQIKRQAEQNSDGVNILA